MTIHLSLFAPSLLLLLFPADRLLSSTVQLRSFESFRSLENSPRHRPWWWVAALWVDPLRALAGTLLLKHALALESADWAFTPKPAYGVLIGVLGLAVLSQLFTRRQPDVMLAPIGFVAGVVAALIPSPVTLIGFAMATAGLFAFGQFHAFFSVAFVTIALLGLALGADIAWLAPAVGVLGLPIVASFLTGSTLELPTRHAAMPLRRPKLST